MADKQTYIEQYMKFFIELWSYNVQNMTAGGKIYKDRPDSTIRIIALTMAEVSWEMRMVDKS